MAPSPAPPPKSGRGLGQRLTAKVGPLPVWAWAAVILGAFFLFTRVKGSSSATPVTGGPNTSGTNSGAQVPQSGQGNPADNMSSDLLAELLGQNQSNYDALLAALQSMTAGGAGGGGDGFSPGLPPFRQGGTNQPVVQNNAPPSSVSQTGPASSATIDPYVTVTSGAGSDNVVGYRYEPTQVDSPSYALAGTVIPVGADVAAVNTQGVVATPTFGGGGTLSSQPATMALVDPSGHVVNAKGGRVGGRTADS